MAKSAKELRKRRMMLVAQICNAAGTLCDSHNRKDREKEVETLERMLGDIVELLGKRRKVEEARKSLVTILTASAFGDDPTVMVDEGYKRHLYLNGHFDVTELSKYIAWGSAPSEGMMHIIGEDHERAG